MRSEELLQRYREMDTEELLDLEIRGTLTPVAAQALRTVLEERAVSESDRARHGAEEMTSYASPEENRRRALNLLRYTFFCILAFVATIAIAVITDLRNPAVLWLGWLGSYGFGIATYATAVNVAGRPHLAWTVWPILFPLTLLVAAPVLALVLAREARASSVTTAS